MNRRPSRDCDQMCSPAHKLWPSTRRAADPGCSVHFVPHHPWPLTWELRCWSWGVTAGAGEPGSVRGPLLLRPLLPCVSDTSLVTAVPWAPQCKQSRELLGADSQLLSRLQLFVVGCPGDPSVKLHGAATGGGQPVPLLPGLGKGVPAGNLSWGGPHARA